MLSRRPRFECRGPRHPFKRSRLETLPSFVLGTSPLGPAGSLARTRAWSQFFEETANERTFSPIYPAPGRKSPPESLIQPEWLRRISRRTRLLENAPTQGPGGWTGVYLTRLGFCAFSRFVPLRGFVPLMPSSTLQVTAQPIGQRRHTGGPGNGTIFRRSWASFTDSLTCEARNRRSPKGEIKDVPYSK